MTHIHSTGYLYTYLFLGVVLQCVTASNVRVVDLMRTSSDEAADGCTKIPDPDLVETDEDDEESSDQERDAVVSINE